MYKNLGSSSYITNAEGIVSQHMEYLPFGELLVDEHKNSYNSPFKYNGKEFDAETGNYYYGARYYDPKWSIFVGVDPLAELAPGWSPYRYGFNNPIKYIDPTGLFETKAEAKEWAKKNKIYTGIFSRHKISENSDGTWSIKNKKDGVSYSKDPEYSNRDDGVTESVYLEGKRSSSGFSFWSKWFVNKRSGTPFWGTQKSDMSGGGAKRGAEGEISGSWDFNEVLKPSGGGAYIPVWKHDPKSIKTNLPNSLKKYFGVSSPLESLGEGLNSNFPQEFQQNIFLMTIHSLDSIHLSEGRLSTSKKGIFVQESQIDSVNRVNDKFNSEYKLWNAHVKSLQKK